MDRHPGHCRHVHAITPRVRIQAIRHALYRLVELELIERRSDLNLTVWRCVVVVVQPEAPALAVSAFDAALEPVRANYEDAELEIPGAAESPGEVLCTVPCEPKDED
jgi:hypothetical protein